MNKLRIGSDLDQVLDDFWNPYIERFGQPKSDSQITKHCQQVLRKDKDFWENLPVLHRPNFNLHLYCTKRTSSKEYAKHWLEINGFNKAPVYQCIFQYGSKAPLIKGRCDLFIDDSVDNFLDLNRKGIPCLLMDGPHNRHLGEVLRVYSMDYDELFETFLLGEMTKVFKEFNEYFPQKSRII